MFRFGAMLIGWHDWAFTTDTDIGVRLEILKRKLREMLWWYQFCSGTIYIFGFLHVIASDVLLSKGLRDFICASLGRLKVGQLCRISGTCSKSRRRDQFQVSHIYYFLFTLIRELSNFKRRPASRWSRNSVKGGVSFYWLILKGACRHDPLDLQLHLSL